MSTSPSIAAFCESMEREGLATIEAAAPEKLVQIGKDLDAFEAVVARLRAAIAARSKKEPT